MSKRNLEIFIEVCDSGSMTVAAGNMGMTQPAVSAAVKELETQYDAKLFERRGRTIELTEAGRRLRQYASTILDQYQQAWNSLHETESTSVFCIGVSTSASEIFLPDLAGTISKEIPGSDIRYITGSPEDVTEMLVRHEADFCIADLMAEGNELAYIPLYKEEIIAVASDRYTTEDALSAAKLNNERLLLREKGCGSRDCLEGALQRAGMHAEPFVEGNSDLALIGLAESGAGIAVLPKKLIARSLKKKRLHQIRIKGTEMKRQYYLIYRSDMHMGDAALKIKKLITDCAGQK